MPLFPTVPGKRGGQFWWPPLGASLRVLARITTPFLLERANPPQDGGAKPWARLSPLPSSLLTRPSPLGGGARPRGGRSPERGRVARLPKGWAGEEPVRPQASVAETTSRRLSGSGDREHRLREGLPCFSQFLPFLFSPRFMNCPSVFPQVLPGYCR